MNSHSIPTSYIQSNTHLLLSLLFCPTQTFNIFYHLIKKIEQIALTKQCHSYNKEFIQSKLNI
jgi:hypothetical protein